MNKKGQIGKAGIIIAILLIAVVILMAYSLFPKSSLGFSLKSQDSSPKEDFAGVQQPSNSQQKQVCEYVKVPYDTYYQDSIMMTYGKTDYYKCDFEYLNYDTDVNVEIAGNAFGNEIHRYYVYVKNEGKKPGDFTVKIYIKDYDGWKLAQLQMLNISPGEQKRFSYKTIYGEEISDWDYEVISKTKDLNNYCDYSNQRVYTDYKIEKRCYWV